MATEVGYLGGQAVALVQIESKPKLRHTLKRWEESLKLVLTSIESKRARAVAAKNEMYLVVSFYLVFQGGVMNMLSSKANTLTCNPASFPAALCILAFVAVLFTVHDKCHDYHVMKSKLKKDESDAKKHRNNIDMMLSMGASFRFKDVDVDTSPEAKSEASAQADVQADAKAASAQNITVQVPLHHRFCTGCRDIFTADRWFKHEPHYYDVMGFLFVVFAIVLINCFYVC